MTITRVPSFLSSRPGFPAGLRVLLLDSPATAREACAQLRQCSYVVSAVSSSGEALEAIAAAAEPFDVLLADAALLSSKCSKQLKDALKELPTLVMSENPKPQEVLASISMGVAEVVEKPLCPLKLKNIWQHTVRRVMGPRLQRCCSKQGLVHGADRKGSVSRLGSLEHSSQSGTPLHLELSPQLSRDLNNTATSCDMPPSSPLASGGCPRGTDGCKDVQADSRRGQKRKLEEAVCSPSTAPCTPQPQQHQQLGVAMDVAASCAEPAVPPAACSAGLPAASVGLPQPTAGACGPTMPVLPHTVAPLPAWPCACPSPPALGPCNLPPGMVWGAPMNPAHVAPGITPPIFPPPMTPPALGPMPGQAWPPCVAPALPQPFPLAGAPMMPGMPPMMMLPGMLPAPACPFMSPSMAAPLPGQLAPLPLPMLMTACAPCPVLPSPGTPPVTAPGLVLPSCSPCSPGSTQPPATSSLSERSSQDALFSAGSHRPPALKAKMPRCESSPLLPSLGDLMAPASTSAEECADMDLDLDTLSLAFRRNNSLEDLMAPPVVAF